MAGSFSAGAKAEMCRNIPSKNCCVLAECFGVLLFCNSFTAESVRIITECHEFAQILPKLFHKAFDLDFDVLPESGNSGKQVFAITDTAKIDRIMNIYGFDRNVTFSLRVNLPIVEEDCCKASVQKVSVSESDNSLIAVVAYGFYCTFDGNVECADLLHSVEMALSVFYDQFAC